MVLLDASTPKDLGGIPPHAHYIRIRNIRSWDEPPGPRFGEFGRKLPSLTLLFRLCTLAMITSFIRSLLNLKELIIDDVTITSRGSPLTF